MQTKFAREQFYPQGWEPCVSQFLELFHRYAYIYRPFNYDHWLSAKEEYWKLSDSEILKAVACAHDKFIGTRAGKTTRYAVLDIDVKSKYHTQAQLDRLLRVLSQAGLSRTSLYRSSFSGGWHLYIFFDEPISSLDLRRELVRLLTLSDFVVDDGVLEVFPHPGTRSLGKGLRLPLQPGWAWLDKRTLEVDHYREESFFLTVSNLMPTHSRISAPLRRTARSWRRARRQPPVTVLLVGPIMSFLFENLKRLYRQANSIPLWLPSSVRYRLA